MVEARAAPWCLRINAGALQAFAKPWLKVLVLLMLVRAFMASLKNVLGQLAQVLQISPLYY
jgi:hypothetical protein